MSEFGYKEELELRNRASSIAVVKQAHAIKKWLNEESIPQNRKVVRATLRDKIRSKPHEVRIYSFDGKLLHEQPYNG